MYHVLKLYVVVGVLWLGCVASFQGAEQPTWINQGLVAYLPMDGVAQNRSANQLVVEQLGTKPEVNRFNELGAALRFQEGLGSAVVIRGSSPDASSLPSGGNARTFSLWYKMDPNLPREPWRAISVLFTGEPDFVNDIGGKSLSVQFTSYAGYRVDFSSPLDGNGGFYGAEDSALFDPAWTHLVIVMEGNAVKTFCNSQPVTWQETPDSSLQVDTSPSDIWLGGYFGKASFPGALDDVRIYNRALSPAEVEQLYAYESTPPENLFLTDGLVAYYPLNSDPADHSLNHNDLEGRLAPAADRNGNLRAASFTSKEDILQGTLSPNPFNGHFSISAWASWNPPSSTRQSIYEVHSQRSPDAAAVVLSRNGAGFPPEQSAELSFNAYYWTSRDVVSPQIAFGPDSNEVVADSTWTQLVAVRGSTWQLFVNGVLVNESAAFPLWADFSDGKFTLGGSGQRAGVSNPIDELADAALDEIRIYNRSLTPAQVQELYAYETSGRRAEALAEVTQGKVTGVRIVDPGQGYTEAPAIVLRGGGGTGATAQATIENGIITSIEILNPGSGYTSLPLVQIGANDQESSLAIRYTRVAVTMSVILGKTYQLESSPDTLEWLPAGDAFVAQDEVLEQEFVIAETGRYFRLIEIRQP